MKENIFPLLFWSLFVAFLFVALNQASQIYDQKAARILSVSSQDH